MVAVSRGDGPNAAHFVHIDCMRAIAALAVAMHHFVGDALVHTQTADAIAHPIRTALYEYMDLGRYGVLLFFIISGYCIANSILRPGPRPVTGFAINRACRIYPAYWLSLAVALLAYGAAVPAEVYLANLTLLQQAFGVPHVLGVYWTLPVELTFYALCVALFLFGAIGSTSRLGTVCLVLFAYSVAAGVIRHTTGIPAPYAWPFFLSLMLAGAVLRRIDDSGAAPGRIVRWGTVGALAGTLVIAITVYADPVAYEKPWYRDYFASAAAILTFVGLHYLWRPAWRGLAWLGTISYSIYLFHLLVAHFALRLLDRFDGLAQTMGAGALTAGLTGLTVAFASATYLAVERPGIRLGRRLVRALESRSATAGYRAPVRP